MVRRRKTSAVIPARRLSQAAWLVLVAVIGVQFALWALPQTAGRAPDAARPPGVEGFLPISALMSLRLWLAGEGVHPVHPAGLAILVGVLAMSALVAKSFCSHICPVGTASEALGRLGVRLLGRTWAPPRWLDLPLRSLKYVLLALFLWVTWVALDLPGVRTFLDSPYNRVADAKMLLFFAHPSHLTVAVLGVLAVGSVLVRDLWCRYLCPYGALLGVVGRLAPFKVTRDAATCTDCGKCTKVCPARLRVHAMTRVASVECTSCQDCVAACPVKGCLAVRPPRVEPGRWRLRPALVVVLVVAVYLAAVTAFRLDGHWRGAVGRAEYARRLPEIDSPLYTHAGGLAAADPSPRPAPPAASHGAR
ncbi:MAG: 4Fe-4S binding protein [Acidobacteria bacterium]|nr:MAG: 4Fe-4S binding protein [Acidobacteriota bacterium]